MISGGQKGVKNVFLWAVNTIMLYLGPNEGTEPKKVKTLIIRAQVTVDDQAH